MRTIVIVYKHYSSFIFEKPENARVEVILRFGLNEFLDSETD